MDKSSPPRKPLSLAEQVQQQKKYYDQLAYNRMVEEIKAKPKIWANAFHAFWIGGSICALGQLFILLFSAWGLPWREASTAASLVMIFLGAFLTGLGLYDEVGRLAGAGTIIPITGFANSIVAPALEFKREGFVFGIAARMFQIAGPVLVYGFLISVFIGLVAYVLP
ncbi:MAG TPA: stage V sporulation protein AC [Moorella mulderi]|nr:stage V sporulation protein AC [Moorella mulderi]